MSSEVLQGICHYGRVRFEVRTAVEPALRCNCNPYALSAYVVDDVSSSAVEDA